ncbi:3,4-dihydroxy-2-butanone-4-phosphate synthase [Ammoniphilus sp. 3BR4]|uniref:3,4-dihydroxy-2-butanone-4-phosphate synthase n=1 Tax=Ammoniphilus sp. 3BR4 TaxID=3158265 RepID=UPI003465E982
MIGSISPGKLMVIFDDIHTNTGYFIGAAKDVTAEAVNFMIKEGKGLVYVCITKEQAKHLELLPMTNDQHQEMHQNFTISVDFKTNTTGISAFERADTIKAFTEESTRAADFRKPGHMFPLVGETNGLLEKIGIVEGVMELSKLISGNSAGYMCEILTAYGEVANLEEVNQIAKLHDVRIILLSELVDMKYENINWLKRIGHSEQMLSNQTIQVYEFENRLFSSSFTVFLNRNALVAKPFIYYETCKWGDVLGVSHMCSCKEHFADVLQKISHNLSSCLIHHHIHPQSPVKENQFMLIKNQLEKMVEELWSKDSVETVLV